MFHILIILSQYSVVQVFNIDLDLITSFGRKCKSASSAELNPIEQILEYKYYIESKKLQYAEFNTRLKLIK